MSAISRDFARYPGCFWGASSGQIPRPFPAAARPRRGWGDAAWRRNALAARAISGLKEAALPIS